MMMVEQFVRGEMTVEDALLCENPAQDLLQPLLTLGDEHLMMGVCEEGRLPVFTRLPVGLKSGFGAGADRVFRALDGMPAGQEAGKQNGVPRHAPQLPPEVRPALVSALTDLLKEGGYHANR